MKILVQSKTLEVTAALRDFIERQLAKLAHKQHRAATATVFLETITRKKNDMQAAIARIKVSIPGKDLVVERRAQDMYTAIVEATERAARYVRKAKEKRLTTKRVSRLPVGPMSWA